MRISVIIDNYNYEKYIEEALESVVKQSMQPYEVIVVDDGSTDNSRNIINSYAKRYSYIKPVYQTNGGQTKAFNTGVSIATGDVVAFLDSDDKWYPEKIAKIVNKHEEYDIVQHFLEVNGEYIYRMINCDVDYISVLKNYGYFYAHTPTSGLSFKLDILKKFMPFNNPEKLRYCTDGAILMLAMVYTQDKRIGFIDEALGYYRVHNSNLFVGNTDNLEKGRDILKIRAEFVNDILLADNKESIPFDKGDYIDACIENAIKEGKLSQSSKVYIWGTEFSGEAVTKALNKRNIYIEGYIDSAANKKGCLFYGKSIKGPEEVLVNTPGIEEVIIIASGSQVAISQVIDKYEWKKNYIKLPM